MARPHLLNRSSLAHQLVIRVVATACALFIAASPALAVVKARALAETTDQLFPTPAVVRKQVRFWERVFYKWPSTTVVVHETGDTDQIIDVIDYKVLSTKDEPAPRKDRDEVTSRYLKRYTKAAERFAQEGESAVKYGAIERRLFAVYRSDPIALKRLYDGKVKIRTQTGLADDFLRAATQAQTYLPYMERVFSQYGVPTRLSRLPFVESMFNFRARSKVGASGIWQFMPDTARNYIYVDAMVDERNSPIKATRAAAQFLLENFRELKSWPLAITAYNHGRLGMANAVKKVGSSDLGDIIKRYESPSYGFASKNFYAEFLAAGNTFERLQREGRLTARQSLAETEAIVLERPHTIADLLRYTPLTRPILEQNNPCLLETSFTKNAHKPLPKFYELRVPRNLARATKTSLMELSKKKKKTDYARR